MKLQPPGKNQSTTNPSGKNTWDRLAELAQSPSTEMEQIVQLIEEVPGLADALIHRANSPEFALRNQIARVEHAIAILGSRRTAETIRVQGQAHSVPAPHFGSQHPDAGAAASV
ncbi:MAG: HDOD domain-containing protein [Pirellulaceae bacterium]